MDIEIDQSAAHKAAEFLLKYHALSSEARAKEQEQRDCYEHNYRRFIAATAAMQSLIEFATPEGDLSPTEIAADAVKFADALLTALEQ